MILLFYIRGALHPLSRTSWTVALVPLDLCIVVMLPVIDGIRLKISDPSEFAIPPSAQSNSSKYFSKKYLRKAPPTLRNRESWEKNLSLLVESKEALCTISKLIQYMSEGEFEDEFDTIRVLALALHLCVGGRYVHLKELLGNPHVVEACIEAEHPFGLIVLALAKQHFGADLVLRPWHPAAIAAMVANTYLDEYWDGFLVCFRVCALECAASIAMSNGCILEELHPEACDLVCHYHNGCSCYDGTQALNYVCINTHAIDQSMEATLATTLQG